MPSCSTSFSVRLSLSERLSCTHICCCCIRLLAYISASRFHSRLSFHFHFPCWISFSSSSYSFSRYLFFLASRCQLHFFVSEFSLSFFSRQSIYDRILYRSDLVSQYLRRFSAIVLVFADCLSLSPACFSVSDLNFLLRGNMFIFVNIFPFIRTLFHFIFSLLYLFLIRVNFSRLFPAP